MKNIKTQLSLALIAGSLIFTACGNNGQKTDEHDHGDHDHSMEERSVSSNTVEVNGDLSPVLETYFLLTSSLARDDASGAAEAGSKMVTAINGFDKTLLDETQLKEFNEVAESALENAEHISENAGEIDHQREHLVSLSEDIRDMIALVGTSQKLYEDFCPMANDSQGAIWISNQKEINNPYMGSAMPTCGKIKREIN
ncbi:MAG TPA: hypothetical protein DIW47_03485 [Bacteroidetes bacterium]|nr:hypothetical protein [Bacteroidota bacterium]